MSDESLQVIPWTGEQLDISTVKGAKRGIEAVQEMRSQLSEFNNACRETLFAEAARRGELSWTDEDGEFVRVGGEGVVEEYDMKVLAELRSAGLPDDRWSALVSWKPDVNGRVIGQLRRNPVYEEIIERAVIGRKPKYRSVRFD